MKRVAQVLADRDEQPPLIRFLPALASLLLFHPAIAFFLTLFLMQAEERMAYFRPLHRDGLIICAALAAWAILRLRGSVGGWTGSGLCLSLYAYVARLFHDITLGMPLPRNAVVADEFASWRASAAFVHPATVTMMWLGFALCTHACVSDWRERCRVHAGTRLASPDPKVFD